MCFIGDLREYGRTPEDARALLLAAVLASRTEGGTVRPAFTGVVMLHAAQYFAERVAEAGGLAPDEAFLGLLGHCGLEDYEDDPRIIAPVVTLDGEGARFFARHLQHEAACALNECERPAPLAAACVAIARNSFAAFAVQSGVTVDEAEGICGAAAYVRLLSYEVKH